MRPKGPPAALPIFRSALQAGILASLYLQPDRAWSLGELAPGASRATLYREVDRLVRAGLVETEQRGRTRLFRAASQTPTFRPLRELIRLTLGVVPQLQRSLCQVKGVIAASLFGSWAQGNLHPGSDIDVLVVGSADLGQLVQAASPVERTVGRPVNMLPFDVDEIRLRIRKHDPFVAAVLAGPMIDLCGDVRAAAGWPA